VNNQKKAQKVLIITYYWPPFGGTGVYRILKFAKYLSKAGWEIVVLTPEVAQAPLIDHSFQQDVPANVKVVTTKIIEPTNLFRKFICSKEQGQFTTAFLQKKPGNWREWLGRFLRMNFFIPDAKIGWYFYAVRSGKKVIRQEHPTVILSTSPPATTHLIAKKLARWSKLRWVADFRDPWTKVFYYDTTRQFIGSKKLNEKFEKSIIAAADRITVVNEGFFPHLDLGAKAVKISNGFDPDDLTNRPPAVKNKQFTIRYLGAFKINQYFPVLFDVLEEVAKAENSKGKIKVEIYGFVDTFIKEKIRQLKHVPVQIFDFKPRSEAVQLMASADLLLLLIGRGQLNKSVISTKIFEYMMVGRPVLGFGPLAGAAAAIIRQTNCGQLFDYEDDKGVKNYIINIFERWTKESGPVIQQDLNKTEIDNYQFKKLTQDLIKVIEEKN